ncbi:MAG: tRNA pseudouridine(55) synthase TruB [Xenococcaceae cyanobacterium]
MLGFINLNKSAGWTSHDCVAKVRRLLKTKKVGHGGTLDPSATGVLPIAVGKATRLLQFLPENKAYRAKILLGKQTTTDDLEGEIIETKSGLNISLEDIQPLLSQFIGSIEQIPPAYSAIKRDGKKLYELARAGKEFEVPVRIVEVSSIEIINFSPSEFPELEVAIACGGGTYIRAIARDLGDKLGVGGTLANLIRTQSCGMQLSESFSLEDLQFQIERESFSLISPDRALEHLQVVTLEDEEAKRWCQGQRLEMTAEEMKRFGDTNNFVRVRSHYNILLGIGEIGRFDRILIPKIVLET